MEDWVRQQINMIKRLTDRPIAVRPHPRSSLSIPGVVMEMPRRLPNTYDDFDLGFDYHAVVNYNSGVGIKAGIAGVPLITDVTSLAHPISIDPAQLESPPRVDRDQWLVEIAHTEYTLQEIREAQWLTRLQKHL
jgi:hypothetical protein